jgi:Mrp family chromosome partitioning ATPase
MPLVADRRMVVCAGAGGVGKTTVSASIALALAQAGARAPSSPSTRRGDCRRPSA